MDNHIHNKVRTSENSILKEEGSVEEEGIQFLLPASLAHVQPTGGLFFVLVRDRGNEVPLEHTSWLFHFVRVCWECKGERGEEMRI